MFVALDMNQPLPVALIRLIIIVITLMMLELDVKVEVHSISDTRITKHSNNGGIFISSGAHNNLQCTSINNLKTLFHFLHTHKD